MQDPRFEVFRVPGIAEAVYYIHDFISEAEEDHLVKKISESPLPKWQTVPTGRRLQYWGGALTKNNALIPEPLPPYFASFPNLVQRVKDTGAFVDSKAGEPNQVLVNEYLPGQGIDPHTDGPAYFPATATVSLLWPTILLIHPPGAPPASNDSQEGDDLPSTSDPSPEPIPIVLEPRSLLLLTGEAYSNWKHEILHTAVDDFGALRGRCVNSGLLGGPRLRELVRPSTEGQEGAEVREQGEVPRQKRLSLTLRSVEKVVKGLTLGGRRP